MSRWRRADETLTIWLPWALILLLIAAWAVGSLARHNIGRGWLY